MNVSYGIYPIGEQYFFDVLERKLEKRSLKGWKADYIGTVFIRYKKCEPKPRKVQIVYDPDNLEYWSEKSDYSEGLEDYIASSGWVKACDYFKQKVYYNDDINAVPIETDDRVRLDTIKESMAPLGFMALLMIVLTVFFGLLFGDVLIDISQLTFRSAAFMALILSLPLYFIISYGMYSLWLDKCEKNLQQGLGLASTEPSHIASIVMVVVVLILGLIVILTDAGSGSPSWKPLLTFALFFIVTAAGRKAAVTAKERKAGTPLTFGIMFLVISLLWWLFDSVFNIF